MTPEQLHQMHLKNLDDYGHLEPYQCMGLCMCMESAGEPREGRIGQGTVVMNRARLQYRGKSIIDCICWPEQFSWTLDSDPEHDASLNIARDFDTAYAKSVALQQCTDMAKGMIEGTIPLDQDLVDADCCEYLNPHTAPDAYQSRLDEGFRVIKTIGRHAFLAK